MKMDELDSKNLSNYADLVEFEKIRQFIMSHGYNMIYDSSINDVFVHDNKNISIRISRIDDEN